MYAQIVQGSCCSLVPVTADLFAVAVQNRRASIVKLQSVLAGNTSQQPELLFMETPLACTRPVGNGPLHVHCVRMCQPFRLTREMRAARGMGNSDSRDSASNEKCSCRSSMYLAPDVQRNAVHED